MTSRYRNEVWTSQRAVLTTRNVELEMLNGCAGGLIPGESEADLKSDPCKNPEDYELRYAVERPNCILGPASLPEHQLLMKKGYVVMLLINLQPNIGHLNCARYIFKSMKNNFFVSVRGTG